MSRFSHFNRRRWGRDSLTGGKQHSILASIGGFLLVPAGVGLGAGLASKALGQTTPQQVATTYAAGHVAGLAACWYGAKKFPAAHSFLRGGMWGEGVVGTLAVMGAASVVAMPTQMPGQPSTTAASLTTSPAASPATTRQQLLTLASNIVSGRILKGQLTT